MYDSIFKNKWDEYSIRTTAITEGIEIGLEQGLERGLEQGLEQGKKQESMFIAGAMKKDGMPVEQIARFTRLTQKEIEKL